MDVDSSPSYNGGGSSLANPGRRRLLIACLLLAALAFRLTLALGWPNNEPDDAVFYAQAARNLVTHGVYAGESAPPLVPTYVRVPGYSLFIAAVYGLCGVGNDTAVRVAQAVVETAGCWCVACLALVLCPRSWSPQRRWRAQAVALLLAAACPFTAIYVTTILTEVLAMALGTALAWCAARALAEMCGTNAAEPEARRRAGRWWLFAGLAGGALTMVRPEGGLLFAGAGATLAVAAAWHARADGRGWRGVAGRVLPAGALLCAGFLVFDGPWIVRNAVMFGEFQPVNPKSLAMSSDYADSGYPHWLRTWINDPKYIGPFFFDQDRARFSIDQLPPWAIDSPEERQTVAELFALYNDGTTTPRPGAPAPDAKPAGMTQDLDRRFDALAEQRIARHPFRYYVVLPAERLFWLWAGPHSDYYPFQGDLLPLKDLDDRTGQHIWLPLFAGLVLVWSLLGLTGAAALLVSPAARTGLLLVALVNIPRLMLLGSMENPEPRYTVELFPFLSALGGVALGWLWPHRDAPPARVMEVP